MSMGLRLWQGQKIGSQTVTRVQVMRMHFEMLICAARDGAGHFSELNTLFNHIPALIEEQLCRKVTIWFTQNGDERFWLDIDFDWQGFNVSVSTPGGSAVPSTSTAGRAYTDELLAHAKFLQRAIEKAKSESGCNGANVYYYSKSGKDAQMKARLNLSDVARGETNRRNAIKGHGAKVTSSVNPFLNWAVGLRRRR